jgi:hypothetical protein
MKKILIIVSMILSTTVSVNAQQTFSIFYVIPPTPGMCDGTIALDGSALFGCSAPYTYQSNCFGSATFPYPISFSGDTIILSSVCESNCSFTVTSASGCIVNIDLFPTFLPEEKSPVLIFYDSDRNRINIHGKLNKQLELTVRDEKGTLVYSQFLDEQIEQNVMQLPELTPGIYIYNITGWKKNGKFLVR